MNVRSISLVLACAILAGGCATKEYVNEQIAALSKRMDARDAQVTALDSRVSTASRTAQEALDRANAAGKLAAGKFLYETVLTSQMARFGFDSSDLGAEMKTALDAFAERLKTENRNVYVEIQGHTDSVGSETVNFKVGRERADAVQRYLATKGIPLHRLGVISYGETAPVADNNTAEGRAENRRVTLVVLQ